MADFSEKAAAAFKAQGVDILPAELGTTEDWSDDEDSIGGRSGASSGDEDEDEETAYQLGFPEEGSNALHAEADWREWDGGRIGGRPTWLNPQHLPHAHDLECRECKQPLRFLLQLYCPVDGAHGEAAFHRALYLFACGKASCVANKSVVSLRCQLPRENDYYPCNPKNADAGAGSGVGASAGKDACPSLCAVCGCRGSFACTACRSGGASADDVARYCSKAHQKQHWKAGHKSTCPGASAAAAAPAKAAKEEEEGEEPSSEALTAALQQSALARMVFPEYDLVVSQEVLVKDSAAAVESSTTIWEDAHTAGGAEDEADLKLKQKDYDSALGNSTRDPEYLKFLSRVRRGGADQVLRYCRWEDGNGALAITAAAAADKKQYRAPDCGNCGSPRAFEFQVMPQLLHYLHVDSSTNVASPGLDATKAAVAQNQQVPLATKLSNLGNSDIEWGTLDVYTCTGSCCPAVGSGGGADGDASAYSTEHVRYVAGAGLE